VPGFQGLVALPIYSEGKLIRGCDTIHFSCIVLVRYVTDTKYGIKIIPEIAPEMMILRIGFVDSQILPDVVFRRFDTCQVK